MNRRFVAVILFLLWIVLAGFGAPGFIARFTEGHEAAGYGSYVVWGLWVSAYIYFIGLSAGAFLVSSLIYVGGFKQLERLGRLALYTAICTLLMALVSIWFDLGRMWRFYRVFTDPNFGSMMAWMVWLYTAYFVLLLVELWLASRSELAHQGATEKGIRGWIGRTLSFSQGPLTEAQRERSESWLRTLAAVGIPLAICFHGGVGALFGTLSARPYWHSPLMPVLFLTGALLSGGGLLTFIVATFWPERDNQWREAVRFLGRALFVLLLVDIMLEWAEFSIPMWYGVGHEYELMTRILFGEYWWGFWILHILLGTLIPLVLLGGFPKSSSATAVAGLLIAVTFMVVRLNLVVPGLVDPHLKGLAEAYQHPRLSFDYVPTLFEWQVTLFVVSIGMLLMYLGFRFLPLTTYARNSSMSSRN